MIIVYICPNTPIKAYNANRDFVKSINANRMTKMVLDVKQNIWFEINKHLNVMRANIRLFVEVWSQHIQNHSNNRRFVAKSFILKQDISLGKVFFNVNVSMNILELKTKHSLNQFIKSSSIFQWKMIWRPNVICFGFVIKNEMNNEALKSINQWTSRAHSTEIYFLLIFKGKYRWMEVNNEDISCYDFQSNRFFSMSYEFWTNLEIVFLKCILLTGTASLEVGLNAINILFEKISIEWKLFRSNTIFLGVVIFPFEILQFLVCQHYWFDAIYCDNCWKHYFKTSKRNTQPDYILTFSNKWRHWKR